jgi:hypothetical protein
MVNLFGAVAWASKKMSAAKITIVTSVWMEAGSGGILFVERLWKTMKYE